MDKDVLITKRESFFNEMVTVLCEGASVFDKALKQDYSFAPPDAENVKNVAKTGNLLIPLEIEHDGKKYHLNISIFQVGNILKIGVITSHKELRNIFELDSSNEFSPAENEWWASSTPEEKHREDSILWEWTFSATNLYTSFQEQEHYIFGLRHMCVRLQNLIHRVLENNK